MRPVSEQSNVPTPGGDWRSWAVSLSFALGDALRQLGFRLNRTVPKDGSEAFTGPAVLAAFTAGSEPDATEYEGSLIYLDDVLNVSDGTAWVPVAPSVTSNANGSYVRIGGLQVCWLTEDSNRTVSSGPSSGVYFDIVSKTFPAAFSAPPVVLPNAIDIGAGVSWGSVSGVPSTSGFDFVALSSNDNDKVYRLSYIAIGPWQ